MVDDEIVESLFEEDMVEDYDDRVKQLKLYMEDLGFDSSIAAMMASGKMDARRVVPAQLPLPVQPQMAWKHKKKRLNIEVNTKAKVLLNNCDLEITGKEIPFKYNLGVRAHNNLIGAIIMFNKEVKKLIGRDSRSEWTSEELDKAIKAVPEIGRKLVRQIKAIQNEQG